LARRGDLTDAIESYRTAIAQREHFPWAYHDLGVALARLGTLEEAVAAYQKAIEQNPRFPRAHFDLGSAMYSLGRVSEATEEFSAAIALRGGSYPRSEEHTSELQS